MSDAVLVVRYREPDRTFAEQKLRRLMRTRSILIMVLALLIALFGPGLLLFAMVETRDFSVGGVLVTIVLFMIPVAMCVFAVRQLRRKAYLPELAVTITPDAVIFPAIDRLTALSPRLRAEEWVRDGTRAEILAPAGLSAARVVFTRQDNGKRRRRAIAAGTLDVDPRLIVDVVNSARTSEQ
ncbi:hypothetical protein [Microbacterium sp. ZW T5_56]|uniref:hypothetical protein n=1 Tax=Microbacterium sp. ZW T5_56 TaxID=3378081 RepID=UPI0038538350